ncbi:MAG: hypothetical protein PHQ80_03105 [Candidatus ainarchaeum sp.]|nr:hypothetical protein [Candidatus ainarchaeum sp.]
MYTFKQFSRRDTMPDDAKPKPPRAEAATQPAEGRFAPSPGGIRGIKAASPLLAPLALGVAVLIQSDAPAQDTFLNTETRNNIGVTMVEAFRSDVRADRSAAERILDSGTYGAVLNNTDDLNMVVRNVNRLLDDLTQPAGARPLSLLGGEGARQRDINSQREAFQSLSAAQKEDLRDRLLLLFAEEAMHGNASTSELQAVVHEQLTGVLGEVASAAPITPVETPAAEEPGFWTRIGTSFASALQSIVPSPAQTFDVELEDGSTVTIGESEARQMLLAAGISEGTIDAFSMADISTDDKVALYFMLDYSNRLNALIGAAGGTMPSVVTPNQMEEAWERSLYATLGFMQSNFGNEYASRGTNLPEIQAAGIAGVRSFVGSVILASGLSSLIANELDPFSQQRISTYTNAVAAVRTEVLRAVVEPKQKIYDELKAELDRLTAQRDTAAVRRAGTRGAGFQAEQAEITALDQRITTQQQQVQAAETALTQAKTRAQGILERFRDDIHTGGANLDTAVGLRADIKSELLRLQYGLNLSENTSKIIEDALKLIEKGNLTEVTRVLRQLQNPEINGMLDRLTIAEGLGRFGTAMQDAFRGQQGLRNPIDVLRGIDTRILDRTLRVGSANNILVLEVNGADISIINRAPFTPSTSVWARMFVDPWRMAGGAGSRGVTIARYFAAPARMASSIMREAFSGPTRGAKLAGWAALLGCTEIAWAIDYHANLTDVRDPLTFLYQTAFGTGESEARQPAQPSTTGTRAEQATPTTLPDATAAETARTRLLESNPELRAAVDLYLHSTLGINSSQLATFSDASQARATTEVKEFLSRVTDHIRANYANDPDAAQIYFFREYLKLPSLNAGRVPGLIEAFVPADSQRDVYADLVQSLMSSPANREMDIFARLFEIQRFRVFAQPVIDVVNARTPGEAGRGENMEAFMQAFLMRLPGEAIPQFAERVAQMYLMQKNAVVAGLIAHNMEGDARLHAYTVALEYLSTPGNERRTTLDAINDLRGHLAPNLSPITRAYFLEGSSQTQLASVEMTRLRMASDFAGRRRVGLDSVTDRNVDEQMVAFLSGYPALRGMVDKLLGIYPDYSPERVFLLLDVVDAVKNGRVQPTIESLTEYLVAKFNVRYPGQTILESTREENVLDMVLAYLPYLPAQAGRIPSTSQMEELADRDHIEWVTTEAALPLLEARFAETGAGVNDVEFLMGMPEETVQAYWNAHPDKWDAIWKGASASWRSAHEFLRTVTRRGRRSRTTYNEWPEETPAE